MLYLNRVPEIILIRLLGPNRGKLPGRNEADYLDLTMTDYQDVTLTLPPRLMDRDNGYVNKQFKIKFVGINE